MKQSVLRLSSLLMASAALAGPLAGCAVGPNYVRPSAPMAPAFKEAAGWSPAAPADALDRGDWWTLFKDPILDGLEAKVQVNNQNVIAAEAAYRQARALVAQDRGQLFPAINLNGSGTKSGSKGGSGSVVTGADGTPISTGGGSKSSRS